MTTTTRKNTRLSGHMLIREGAPFNLSRKYIGVGWSSSGRGRGLCTCHELSDELNTANERKAWHRTHKAEIRAARAAAQAAAQAKDAVEAPAPAQPVAGIPVMTYEHDDNDQPILSTPTAGWDLTFGCRLNAGPNTAGQLALTIHVSDKAQREGVAQGATTPEELRVFAAHLLRVAHAYEQANAPAPEPTALPHPTDTTTR